ncbi:MAG: hypothetical protein HKL80_01445 [Acidimicrobiales bacterium]|nr:hypothetical protein [Acidimicrobiales bacterium]
MLKKYDRSVRCRNGHVFTTIWVPLASFKAARLCFKRYQHCPVGHHWSMIEKIDSSNATTDELARASEVHDVRIP